MDINEEITPSNNNSNNEKTVKEEERGNVFWFI
jgi:hypothetical protein